MEHSFSCQVFRKMCATNSFRYMNAVGWSHSMVHDGPSSSVGTPFQHGTTQIAQFMETIAQIIQQSFNNINKKK